MKYPTPDDLLKALTARPDDKVQVNQTVTAGMGGRRTVRQALQTCELQAKCDVQWREDKGLLDSVFTLRLDGTGRTVAPVVILLRDLAEALS